nr:hypothetical protein BaRGS_005982 [Batillaria attramentaria]
MLFSFAVQQHCTGHVFSIHDNRQAFLNDAVVFEGGLGRRRVPKEEYTFKPDFYTWMPLKEEIERSRPLVSTYKLDFNKNGKKQMWVKRPMTSFENQPCITTYRYAHGKMAPNREEIVSQAMPTMKLALEERQQRAKTVPRRYDGLGSLENEGLSVGRDFGTGD